MPHANSESKVGKKQNSSRAPKRGAAMVSKAGRKNGMLQKQATQQRVASALRAMRNGAPMSRAASEHHVSVRSIRRYASDALVQDRPGARITVTKDDKLPRYLLIPGTQGPREIEVRGLKAARQFARYQAAVNRFLRGDGNALAEWHGKKIAGIELITAGETLKSLAQRDRLPQSFYRAFTGGAR